ncbi:golgin subfamily B member 1 isoform X4 [Drosophila mojavensis]|uniref:golgin subfamily B member 1 isoform X4 n=1 Tax=Drosophila mojavensis TaxID=7230 RepID=UPI001CD07D1D|nr:golgin subfamily B member 1 isoform X4 [Drosophila mojavensis]
MSQTICEDDAQPKMRFSLSPPPPKVSLTPPTSTTSATSSSTTTSSSSSSNNNISGGHRKALSRNRNNNNMLSTGPANASTDAGADEALSDYNQWLHAMKLVARLPGGTPPEFRRKLWLSLADKYLKSKNIDWAKQREKCFCEEWREDDEELGIQIVKDLHRTGSNLCTGPAGSINQAKLKRILLGYARYNPEVGYCQGFNMLGALILQVMDKEEEESMKVMIYLVEGVLPTGYFYGSMGGLQADMGVFRELMQTKLPRLAKHLQRLQGPMENAYEPPLTNVFTMQWFLTMFCTCLPMSCVLRVWDLVLIEGSDVLLRTALVLWSLLEERVLNARTADDFYGKMGSFSNELLNGHLIDSNGLIEKVVQLGPIADIKQLREKHLYNITPLANKQGLQLYYDEEDTHSDDESRMAVATVWGLNWGRRGSVGTGATGAGKPQAEQKDRLALDISLLKKQYDRLRERQKQAHVILTSACSTATAPRQANSSQLPVNQLLLGRPAIITNKGKRVGAPLGAIPPARKPSLPAVLHSKPPERQLRRGETLLWRDTDATQHRRDSLTWKEIKADRAAIFREGSDATAVKSQKLRSRLGKSDSSSYSEDSDGEQEAEGKDGSSTDTSLCDDDDPKSSEQSPRRKAKLARKLKEKPKLAVSREPSLERRRPKSWAPSSHEIPFMLMGTESGDEKEPAPKEEEDSATECDRFDYSRNLDWSKEAGDLASSKIEPLIGATLPATSTAQLSPLRDMVSYLGTTSISELPSPRLEYAMSDTESVNPPDVADAAPSAAVEKESTSRRYDVSDDGVTNQYFERVNSVERPKRLELSFSLNEEDAEKSSPMEEQRALVEGQSAGYIAKSMPFDLPAIELKAGIPLIRDDNIPGENKDDYKEVLSMTIETKKDALPTILSSASRKRRDPRRKTLTRSSTIELEERFQALERRFSQEKPNRHSASDKLEGTKYIPSTAALEERFNTLEKQLSAEKQGGQIIEPTAECFEKPERIPSTADLEMRFNALAKQMSSTESNAKAPIELRGQEQPAGRSSKEGNESEKTSKLHKLDDSQTDTAKPANECDATDKKESESKQKTETPRLKKLPSTAELEDRFNALERRISVQKASPTKAKKEPPDEGRESKKTSPKKVAEAPAKAESKPESKEVAEEVKQTKKETSDAEIRKHAEGTKPEASDKKDEPAKASPSKNEKIQSEKKEPVKSKESLNEDDKKVEVLKRKSPPSTEELEKRFNALEKQLSTSKGDTNGEVDNEKSSNKAEPVPQEEKQTKQSEQGKENKVKKEEEAQKSIKSFDEKVKAISATLTNDENTSEVSEATLEKRRAFETTCKTANRVLEAEQKPLATETNEDTQKPVKPDQKSDPAAEQPEKTQPAEHNKRRASEPPSMEDLDKRYETLKRRMSSKNHLATQNETVNEALERIEQEVMAELGDSEEDTKPIKKQPPTTEDLESRYEALHSKDTKETESKSKPALKSPPRRVDVAIEAHIPEPPPPPPAEHRIIINPGQHQQRALIEELQSKIKAQSPGEENLRPSEINPQRKRQPEQRQLQQRPTTMGDETSEAPATTAYYRSGNYEPWQSQRTVRRFSDLPSRADLENRLQFLEKKLYKKFYKQRCASDSEVASRMFSYEDKPSTSHQAEAQLEQRVLALEKQLSENSLKLLEAVREKEKQQEKLNHNSEDLCSPRRLSTDMEIGKELVRYTQNITDVEESDKPINISINIKMLLNKENEQRKPPAEPNTDDLRRRLEQLELELSEARARNGTIPIPDVEASTEDAQLPSTEQSEETETSKKQEKDSHNQSVKCDEAEKLEEPAVPLMDSAEPETVKETKTLQNEEKAQSGNKESDLADATKEEQKAEAKTVNEENEKKIEKKCSPSIEEPKIPDASLKNDPQPNSEKSDAIEQKSTSAEEPLKNSEENLVINPSDIGPVDPNNKTVVLLMDNEPKALKVRRLTRANTEELEGLFQALEKQLNDRNLVKSKDGKLVRAESKPSAEQVEQAQAISDLTKEIEDFTSGKPEEEAAEQKQEKEKAVEEDPNYDWGPNPVKHHLKRKTVYLPSTKELEARFRSLERQIKLLEDVEKIDVEQRLCEIERKIKLQYSLSHEKDLNKFLELCEGKGLDDEEDVHVAESTSPVNDRSRSPSRKQASSSARSPYTSPVSKSVSKSPYVSPSRKEKSTTKSPYTSPSRREKSTTKSPYTSPSRQSNKTQQTSPARAASKKSPYTSPARRQPHKDDLPISDDLEYKYRVLDLVRSKSKDNLSKRKTDPNKKPPIHPLEMLLDPSPDDSEIPTTGELEHRIRLLDEKLKSPVRHKSRSRSPTIEDIKRKKMLDDQQPKTPVHSLERLVYSPSKPEPPTAEELDKRILALEKEQRFDFKTQKDYKEFNQKLKDVVSPSLSYEEFKLTKSREQSPRRQAPTTPKSAMRREEIHDDYRDYRREETTSYRPTSPKVIRFRDEDEDYYEDSWRPKSRQSQGQGPASERMKTLADQPSASASTAASRSYISSTASEGVDALGSRLMRETSPITRTGTHTGVPLRTGDNINDRLSSIKNSIKSIDSLCEEKSYQKEKCQRYIDSLFSDSLHFSNKKSSAEDLTHSRSESRGRGTQRCSDYTPTIRISSEHRSLGSVESLRTGSPLRAANPPHHRSHRDVSRELSPRRRRETEELEERESSRVRRDNMLPNYLADNRSELGSSSSLTKFHKVDRQLEETCAKYADDRRSACKSPLSSPYESRTAGTRYNTTATVDSFPRPVSPYRQPYDPSRPSRSNTPVYQPAKLEIRHTTVTSTFYDRFLTEKQIEKQTLPRPPSRSPVLSPSAATKSYSDLPSTLTAHKYGHELMPDVAATSASSYSPMSRSYAGSSSNYSYLTPLTTASDLAATSTPAGSASDQRLRNSSENIPSPQPNPTLTPTTTSTSSAIPYASVLGSSSTASTASAFVPYNFSSSFSSRLGDPASTSGTSTLSSYSTGVYNPMMSFTLREPQISSLPSSSSGQYQFKSAFGSTLAKSELDKP